ncbi:MAG: sugar ABC transporter substrate-binding protein [Candidatus Sericytochromatia bacterium]|nr:sugar ABC transporter substrate-binding protein [Candidatus Sericytochromatia bacterium]
MQMIRFLRGLCLAVLFCLSACTPRQPEGVIRLSTWGSPEEMAILKPLLQRFEVQSGLKVELMHIPDKYFQKLHALLAANLAPDVMFVNNIQFPVYASNGAFLDLGPRLAASDTLKEADFFPQSLDSFRWEGQLQALPRDVSNLVIFYNRDLFDAAGLPYPRADWTLTEMFDTAQKLSGPPDAQGQRQRFGISFSDYFLFWLPYVWSAGGDIFDASRSRLTLNEPAALAGLQQYADLRHQLGAAPKSAEAGSLSMSQLFMQQKLAMNLNGRWAVPLYRQNLEFNWDIVPFPQGPAGSIVDADASGWVISSQTRQPEAAWQLVSFLAGQQAAEAFSKPGLIIPARRDVAYSETFLTPGQPPASAHYFLEAIDSGRPVPAVPYWNAVLEQINQALEPVWEGRLTAEEALKGLEQRVDPLL